jgi:hypothetical protein
MWLLVQCFVVLADIRSRIGVALVRPGAHFVNLRRLVDFGSFPKSARLGIHRNAHDYAFTKFRA